MALNGRQKRHLRGLGHHLKPLVTIGRAGITDTVVSSAQEILAAHELIKVRIGNNCSIDRREAAETLAARTGAEVVQVMSKTALIFRVNHDRDDEHRIRLPG